MINKIDLFSFIDKLNEDNRKSQTIELSAEIYYELKSQQQILLHKSESLSHSLLRTKNDLTADHQEWHIIEKRINSGAFADIYSSNFKIILTDGHALITACDDILKELQWEEDDSNLEQILIKVRRERQAHYRHRLKISEPIIDKNNHVIFLLMENYGDELYRYLHKNNDLNLNARLKIALAVANEVQLLQQAGTIHGDIKLENIGIKKLKSDDFNDDFQVRLFDFGLAHSTDKECIGHQGTPCYMSPEFSAREPLLNNSVDYWAFGAVLGAIFLYDTESHFKNCPTDEVDLDNSFSRSQYFNRKYCYKDLFDQITIPNDIDQSILNDIRELLEAYQDFDPKKRPNIDITLQFFASIEERQAINRQINDQSTDQDTQKILKQTIERVSHLKIVKESLKRNKTVDQLYELAINNMTTNYHLLKIFIESNKFHRSNSKGVESIYTIVNNPNISVLKKLQSLKALGQAKTNKCTLSYWWSQSRFIGKGRHENMEALYNRLAKLNVSTNSANQIAQIRQIGLFIQGKNFVEPSKAQAKTRTSSLV